MKVECIALTDFTHDDLRAREGRTVMLPKFTAEDLERRGLVRIKRTVKPLYPAKSLDDGQGQPSSASPAAPVLQQETSKPSARGRGRPRKVAA
jgi:hypothetical protein